MLQRCVELLVRRSRELGTGCAAGRCLTLGNLLAALVAPDVEGYLKADDQDALVNPCGPLTKGVGAMVLRVSHSGGQEKA